MAAVVVQQRVEVAEGRGPGTAQASTPTPHESDAAKIGCRRDRERPSTSSTNASIPGSSAGMMTKAWRPTARPRPSAPCAATACSRSANAADRIWPPCVRRPTSASGTGSRGQPGDGQAPQRTDDLSLSRSPAVARPSHPEGRRQAERIETSLWCWAVKRRGRSGIERGLTGQSPSGRSSQGAAPASAALAN